MASHKMLSLLDEENGEGRRRHQRQRVLLAAKLVTTSRELPVTIRDLSAYGARIEGASLPPPASSLYLRRGTLELFSTMIWCRGGSGGIEFEEPLDEWTMAELQIGSMPLPGASAAPLSFRRPDLTQVALSPEEMGRQSISPAALDPHGE